MAMIWAIARAEMRSTRRLSRYWVFSILAVLIAFATYIYYAAIHGNFSHMSAAIGAVGPRFLVSALGIYMLILFLLGLVFLAFDVRSRDVRERMVEVLDSRAISNLEFVLGRGMGLVLMSIFPVVFLIVLLQSFGALALALDWPIGQPMEPYSLVGLLFDALGVFFMWCSVVVLLAVVVRNRLLVAVLSLAIIGLQLWSFFQAPVYLQPIVGFMAAFLLASDVLPTVMTFETGFQRLSLVVLGLGFFALAAALHPRRDGWRKTGLAVGTGFVAVAAVMLTSLFTYTQSSIEQSATWAAAHADRSGEPRVDVVEKAGSVVIDPGSNLALDLTMVVKSPENEALDTLLFTLNPGLTVDTVMVDGRAREWTHVNGLLEIEASLGAGAEATIDMVAGGEPNTSFGYLDSAINFFEAGVMDANISILGVEVSVFDSRYVALMPGGHWLPTAGTAVPYGDERTHPADYFDLDLEVTVPDDWTVAGPGLSEAVGAGTYRFNPGAPLPMVGLMASEFVARSVEVEGVTLEVLVHPKHTANLEVFDGIGDELEIQLGEWLADAKRYGLEYPYGKLTLVETPSIVRGYGGGWRMDSTQMMPGLVLMKETSFPTARFANQFEDTTEFDNEGITIEEGKIEILKRFFANDIGGGNVLLAAARHLVAYQTSAEGEGALALNFVLDELVSRLLDQQNAYFSPYVYGSQSQQVIGETVTNMVSGRSESVAQSVRDSATNRPSVWDLALGTPLADLDVHSDPQAALNVLALKGNALGFSLVLSVGKEKVGAMLKYLVDNHRGETFTAAHFDAAAAAAGIDLASVVGDWLHDAELAGFLTSPVQMVRLEDDDRGEPVYQTTVHVRNDEATPGLIYFTIKAMSPRAKKGGLPPLFQRSGPHLIGGNESVEIGIVTNQPVVTLMLNPFLSLNRREISLSLPRVDSEQIVDDEPFLGMRPSDWLPNQGDDIYVDDLDEGFAVSGTPPVSQASNPFVPAPDVDQGLPQYQLMFGMPAVWSRQENETSWGKYRHTAALVRAGDGTEQAHFRASIPRAGKWRLAYHVPNLSGSDFRRGDGNVRIQGQFGPELGTYDIALIAGGQTREIEFDAGAAEAGWSTLGDFDLASGEVEVRLTNATSGGAVVADAIRFSPVGG
jgi:hypothetical protein